jgi:DNA-binding NarL/FixJ family response regulator
VDNGEIPHDGRIHIALANDYDIVVAGLAAMLAPFGDRVAVDELFVGELDPSLARPVDVLLFDTYGRSELGFEALTTLTANPSVRHVVIYTWEGRPPFVDRALRAGVSGWLTKSLAPAELVDALERVAGGEQVVIRNTVRAPRNAGLWPGQTAALTERESEVLSLLAKGLRNAEIAKAMFLSPETVKFHLRHLYRKLGVSSRGEAIAFAHSSEWFRLRHGGTPAVRSTYERAGD